MPNPLKSARRQCLSTLWRCRGHRSCRARRPLVEVLAHPLARRRRHRASVRARARSAHQRDLASFPCVVR
eukprot:3407149-Pleurochrysis_carterae.AAC.1